LRSQINQPDPAFPRSPGIIRETCSLHLTFSRRFVLSMNCKHHIRYLHSAHSLICTAYAPKSAGEEAVDKKSTPVKSKSYGILPDELFTEKLSTE
jgi:hypothetical protein